MTWQRFETDAPELARVGAQLLEQPRVAVVGTIRSDGSPRISAVEPVIVDGGLYLGMLWRSRKALDLRRDPRIVVRNAICTNTGDEVEISLRGRAVEIDDLEVRRRFAEAVLTPWREPHFHLFAVEIQSVGLIRYGGGQQAVQLWPQGVAFQRPYEE